MTKLKQTIKSNNARLSSHMDVGPSLLPANDVELTTKTLCYPVHTTSIFG